MVRGLPLILPEFTGCAQNCAIPLHAAQDGTVFCYTAAQEKTVDRSRRLVVQFVRGYQEFVSR